MAALLEPWLARPSHPKHAPDCSLSFPLQTPAPKYLPLIPMHGTTDAIQQAPWHKDGPGHRGSQPAHVMPWPEPLEHGFLSQAAQWPEVSPAFIPPPPGIVPFSPLASRAGTKESSKAVRVATKSTVASSSDETSEAEVPEADALVAEAMEVSLSGVGALLDKEMDPSEAAGGKPGRPCRADQSMKNITDEGFTTLMIRNLPHNLVQCDLVRELDESGFKDLYDFVYMPSIFHSGRAKGYAFVNFVCPTVACVFMNSWHKSCRFDLAKSRKTLDISVACIQGRDANVMKWDDAKRRRVQNPNFRPVIKPGAGGREARKPEAGQPVAVPCQNSLPAANAAQPGTTGLLGQWMQQ